MLKNNSYNPILIAIDTSNINLALNLINKLKNKIGGIKIGMNFFYANGLQGIKKIARFNIPIFIDLKLLDISNTIAKSLYSLLSLNPFMINIHILGGRKMLKSAVSIINKVKNLNSVTPMLIGVTIITSMEDLDIKEIGFKNTILNQVILLAKLAKDCGLDGVVCSPHEVSAIKNVCGNNFKTIVPGIRLKGTNINDQKRTMTPSEAINQGADYLVIGRPITLSKNPIKTINKILKSIYYNNLSINKINDLSN